MSQKHAKPQMPGGASEGTQADTQAIDEPNAPVEQAGDVVTMPRAEFEALSRRLAAVEAQQTRKMPNAAREAELPNADNIDQSTLKSPVLTKTGWLVPEKFGSHPNAPK